MDHGLCNVIYLDRRVRQTTVVRRGEWGTMNQAAQVSLENVRAILSTFGDVYVCRDGSECLQRLNQIDDPHSQAPTVVLIDIPYDEHTRAHQMERRSRTPSPSLLRARTVEKDEPVDLYGMDILLHLSSCVQSRTLSRLVLPVAILNTQSESPDSPSVNLSRPQDSTRMLRYLDAGACDVLTAPLSADRVQSLAVHAYKAFKDVTKEDASFVLTKRSRKLSWIGIEEERPFAYLRESMVSGLMEGICNPDSVNDSFEASDISVDPSRQAVIKIAVGQWSFSAHDFTSDELIFAAHTILQHALQLDELQTWRMSSDDLTIFLLACRKAYNDFVLYHNFRHVVDVLQAIFFFLLQIGILPPYQDNKPSTTHVKNRAADSLTPFDALTLLVAAIGHDVGHPGVNNAFLVALNAPLAQLYNDRSVLEAFHCAAYSQILRRYWPAAFSNIAMRKLMINSILATDMGLHFKYMLDMGGLQDKINPEHTSDEDWTPKVVEETRDLICGLLIKCADISNVARKYGVAAQWARILTDEFSNQGAMEKELDLPTCLFGGPPDPSDSIKLAESQLGFMSMFARPLFEGVSSILPAMQFSLTELSTNKTIWQEKIAAETKRRESLRRTHTATSPVKSTFASSLPDTGENTGQTPMERDSFWSQSRDSQLMVDKQRDGPNSRPLSHDEAQSPLQQQTSRNSLQQPTLAPFPGPGSLSRRSSKDIALEHMDKIRSGQRNSCSKDNQSMTGSRRESGEGSLATILVRNQRSFSSRDMSQISPTSSPKKSLQSDANTAVETDSSIAPNRSPATSNATQNTSVPMTSTKASSLEDNRVISDGVVPQVSHNIASTENPFIHPNGSPDMHPSKDHHSSAPDVLYHPAQSPGKSSLLSNLTATGDDEDTNGRSHLGDKHEIRAIRSHSRLKNLKFWRKKWKGPDFESESPTSQP